MQYSITQVRNNKHYHDLLKRISLLNNNIHALIHNDIVLDKINVLDNEYSDEYGLVYKNRIIKLLKNPKRIFHEFNNEIFPYKKKGWI